MNRKAMAILGIMLAATLSMSSMAQADGAAPGEGYYVGAFLGYGAGIVQPTVNVLDIDNGGASGSNSATFEADRGGFGLSGIQGGGWLGWGMKTADDLYFGAEITAAGSDEKIELTSSVDLAGGQGTSSSITSASAKRNWVAGGAVRVGYYVNSDTLFALSGGIAVSQFDVTVGADSETVYAGGPQVGASLTTNLSKIDPNLGLRMEAVYTDYLTADINGIEGVNVNSTGNAGKNNNSEITGSDVAARVGITYRF